MFYLSISEYFLSQFNNVEFNNIFSNCSNNYFLSILDT